MYVSPTKLKGQKGVKMFLASLPTGQYPLEISLENRSKHFQRSDSGESIWGSDDDND